MSVVAEKTSPKRKVRPAGRVASLRGGLTAWLSRPLADFHLLLAIFGMLTVLGLVMVLSASAPGQVASGVSAYSVFQKQLIYVCIGAVLFWLVMRFPLRRLRHMSTAAMGIGVLLLALVLTPLGDVRSGAQS
ncbi:MAG: cell division protein FtsW, partial [Pseudonocardiales bacterium]|nr:cell division protein FtsW [Pseudonocardiales bacterium]